MTCSIRDNAEQKIWNMVNIYKGLKRRGGKKKPLKIGILGLKSKFSAMLSSKINCMIWKKIHLCSKEKKYMKKWKEKKSMWYMKILLDLTHNWRPYNHFCLSGCMAERLKHKILDKEKMVDLVCGPDAYRDLPRLLSVTSGSGQSAGQ